MDLEVSGTRAFAIYNRALDLEGENREAFLAEACAGNRARVRSTHNNQAWRGARARHLSIAGS